MENNEQLQLAFRIALTSSLTIVVAVSIFFFATQMRKRNKSSQPSSCYLLTEPKPQTAFTRLLADNSYSQFKHLKRSSIDVSETEEYTNLHPYKAEIGVLLKNPNVDFLEDLYDEYSCTDSISNNDMNDSHIWIETETQLMGLAKVLSKERVFAVDTEQHSLRSFLGFTALVQISTKREDYLVDTIALHDVMDILRPVFADPNICKVFHGADNDVLWLQRDFHIYVVNLFDTAKACDVLSKQQRSLAYLLETYCGVVSNKLLQREDWRQRPLPAEMVQYARADAHYLLYIVHRLSLELEQHYKGSSPCPNDKYHFAFEASRRSNSTSLQLFSKEIEAYPGESAAASINSRQPLDQGSSSSTFTETNFKDRVRRLCAWRDIMARIHDESLRFILSENAIIGLADKFPTTEMDVCGSDDLCISSGNPSFYLQSPSSVVSSHLEDFSFLFQGEMDDIFQIIIEKHLSQDGACPLSLYNYALLSQMNLKITDKSLAKQNVHKTAKHAARKASRELFIQKFSCKSIVYHNCRIYANDGRLLCYCDRRKLEWYTSRGLAKLVEDDPPAIMLLFEPKGRPEDEDNDFYIQSKKNVCVGCGEGNHYLRYRIIPSCYRVHFPEHMKSHRSHDIVLLCVDCHEIAHAAAEKYKKQVAAEFGIPLFIRKVVDRSEMQNALGSSANTATFADAGVSPLQLRTAAMALVRHGPRMPFNRREELTQIVMKFYGGRDISEEDLENALVAGMSPHERRKFVKKRGVSFKNTEKMITLENKRDGDNSLEVTYVDRITSGIEYADFQDASKGVACNRKDDVEIFTSEDTNINDHSSSSGTHIDGEISDSYSKYTVLDKSENLVMEHVNVSGYDDRCFSPSQRDRNCKSAKPSCNLKDFAKNDSKLSLLGHGPHGKLVIDLLLKKYGEDGVRQFCQRWRQVFVEAVHPRFLPAGWDVMHSGRRDFGEFSVYSRAKKGSSVFAFNIEEQR